MSPAAIKRIRTRRIDRHEWAIVGVPQIPEIRGYESYRDAKEDRDGIRDFYRFAVDAADEPIINRKPR